MKGLNDKIAALELESEQEKIAAALKQKKVSFQDKSEISAEQIEEIRAESAEELSHALEEITALEAELKQVLAAHSTSNVGATGDAGELKALNDKIAALEAAKKGVEEEKEKELEGLSDKVAALEAGQGSAGSSDAGELKVLNDKIAALEAAKKESRAAILSFEEKEKELKALRVKNVTLEAQLKNAKLFSPSSAVAEAGGNDAGELKALSDEIAALEAAKKEAEEEKEKELKALSDKNATLEAELKSAKLSSPSGAAADAGGSDAELKGLNDKIAALEADLEKVKGQADDDKAANVMASRKLTAQSLKTNLKLKEELKQLKAAGGAGEGSSALQEQLTAKEDELQHTIEKWEADTKKLKEVQDDLLQKAKALQRQKEQVKEINKECTGFQKQILQFKEKEHTQTATIDKLNARIQELGG